MRRTKIKALFVGMATMLLLSGCGNEIPEMTEEQNQMITEYAAGLLLAYNVKTPSRLVDTSKPKPEEKSYAAIYKVESTPTASKDVEEEVEENAPESTDSTTSTEQAPEVSLPIAQVLGLDNFRVDFISYELTDSYPSEGDDLFFAMSASSGNKLLVSKLQVTNTSGEDAVLDTIGIPKAKYKTIINGDNKVSVLMTMLSDDFSAMKVEVPAGQSIITVLVSEISQDAAAGLSSVQIEVKNDDQSTKVACTNGTVVADIDSQSQAGEPEESNTDLFDEVENAELENTDAIDDLNVTEQDTQSESSQGGAVSGGAGASVIFEGTVSNEGEVIVSE